MEQDNFIGGNSEASDQFDDMAEDAPMNNYR